MSGKVIFFWDFDAQWGADNSRSNGGRKNWGHLDFENTERILALHEQYQIPACFAVVAAVALGGSRPYHDAQLIRKVHDQGHEVACHSMYHEWLPGLGERVLRRQLRESKDALEQCIGNSVFAFVPPFNRPMDYFRRGSISISERVESGMDRIDIPRLCELLAGTGYLFCRISYAGPLERLQKLIRGSRPLKPSRVEFIHEITCIRLNAPAGFGKYLDPLLDSAIAHGGIVQVYAHPHSFTSGGPQDEKNFEPFLKKISSMRQDGDLEVALPRQLVRQVEIDES